MWNLYKNDLYEIHMIHGWPYIWIQLRDILLMSKFSFSEEKKGMVDLAQILVTDCKYDVSH